VTDFFTTLSTIAADPRFFAAAAVALVSGAVRGFSGFGSALIYIPLMAAIYDPRIAALTLLITDYTASAPLTVTQMRHCNWREVAPVSIAAIATVPLGVAALQYFDAVSLRWFIACLVVAVLAVLISGWRYRARPAVPISLAVGAMAGFGAGAVYIAGPPAIAYWLGGPNSATVVRANLIVYFGFVGLAVGILYYLRGLFTSDVLMLSLLLGPLYIVSIAAGAYVFRESSEQAYRRVSYVIIGLSALVSLPLFDALLR
jgi:hypothetical protein